MKQEYARLVTLAAWAATIIASILLIVKVAAWWVTGSVSLLTSVVDSLLDSGFSRQLIGGSLRLTACR